MRLLRTNCRSDGGITRDACSSSPAGDPGTALKHSHLSESERWRRTRSPRFLWMPGRAAELPLAKSGASLPW